MIKYWKDLCKKAAAQELQVFFTFTRYRACTMRHFIKMLALLSEALWATKGCSLLGTVLKSSFCNQTEHCWKFRSSLHPSKTATVVWAWWWKPTDTKFLSIQLLQTLTAQLSAKWSHLMLFDMSCLVPSSCYGKAGDPLCVLSISPTWMFRKPYLDVWDSTE